MPYQCSILVLLFFPLCVIYLCSEEISSTVYLHLLFDINIQQRLNGAQRDSLLGSWKVEKKAYEGELIFQFYPSNKCYIPVCLSTCFMVEYMFFSLSLKQYQVVLYFGRVGKFDETCTEYASNIFVCQFSQIPQETSGYQLWMSGCHVYKLLGIVCCGRFLPL